MNIKEKTAEIRAEAHRIMSEAADRTKRRYPDAEKSGKPVYFVFIAGYPEYENPDDVKAVNFSRAEKWLNDHLMGRAVIINTSSSLAGEELRQEIEMAILTKSTHIYMLDGWRRSRTASMLFGYAVASGKNIILDRPDAKALVVEEIGRKV